MGLDLAADPNPIFLLPGTSATVDVLVTNNSSMPETVALVIRSRDEATFAATLAPSQIGELKPGESAAALLTVSAAADVDGGKRAEIVIAAATLSRRWSARLAATAETSTVSFSRAILGDRARPHKVAPGKPVQIRVSLQSNGDLPAGTLADHFPMSWTVADAGGGTVSAVDAETMRIVWTIGASRAGQKTTKSYRLITPSVQGSPRTFRLFSAFLYDSPPTARRAATPVSSGSPPASTPRPAGVVATASPTSRIPTTTMSLTAPAGTPTPSSGGAPGATPTQPSSTGGGPASTSTPGRSNTPVSTRSPVTGTPTSGIPSRASSTPDSPSVTAAPVSATPAGISPMPSLTPAAAGTATLPQPGGITTATPTLTQTVTAIPLATPIETEAPTVTPTATPTRSIGYADIRNSVMAAATGSSAVSGFPWLLAVADPATSEGLDPYLHPQDVAVGSTLYNYMTSTVPTGPESYLNTPVNTKDQTYTFRDAAGISTFVSDAVPEGRQWNLSGTWNFDIWVKASTSLQIDWFQAVGYRIARDGTATALWSNPSKSNTYNLNSSTWTNATWSQASVSAVLYAGERYAIEFQAIPKDNTPGATATLAYNDATHDSNIITPLVDSVAPAAVRTNHYRIGQDTSLTNMSWYADTDVRATNMPQTTNFRVRFQVYNDGGSNKTWTPQLQSSTSQTGGWTAVTTSSTNFQIVGTTYYGNATPITTTYFGLGTSPGSAADGIAYDGTVPGSITLNAGRYTEIEFNIQATASAGNTTTYYFRLTDNGAALTAYYVYAAITTRPTAGLTQSHDRIGYDRALNDMAWYSSTDAPGLVQRNQNFRVRFQVYNDSGSPQTWLPRLEWSLADVLSWKPVTNTPGTDPFNLSTTSAFANGAPITTEYFALGSWSGTAVNGAAYENQNPGNSFTLQNNQYTELEFNIQANSNASVSGDYLFRLTRNGTVLTNYLDYGEVIIQDPIPGTPTPGPPAHNNNQPYGPDTAACAACHRVHTAKSPETIQKTWPEEAVCYTCHDGTAAPNIKAQFAKTYRMPITATIGVHTVAESHDMDSSHFRGANRHVECTDCHNPHYAARGNHPLGSNFTHGPQQGVWGVAATYTDPWLPPVFTPVTQVTYMYQLCFKCHSSWAFGNNPPFNQSGGFAQTDQSKEFNPLNASYMPVVAQGKNTFVYVPGGSHAGQSYADSLTSGLYPTSTISCVDCHRSEPVAGASPTPYAGPHGSANPFILRAPYDRTTGQNTGNGGVNTSSHLCFQCHSYNVYTNSSNQDTWNQTGFSGEKGNLHAFHVGSKTNKVTGTPIVCMDCHIAIPHGYYRWHLLGFTGDGPPYVNRPYTGNQGLYTINHWGHAGNWYKTDCQSAMNNCS